MAGARGRGFGALVAAVLVLVPVLAVADDHDVVEVTRVAGPDRVATAVAASRRAFPDGADAAVIASDRDFPDALAAAPLAAQLGGPVLITGERLDARVRDELRRLEVESVTVVGGVRAVPYLAQAELEHLGFAVDRIAGADRYDTAALIARRVGGDEAVLADGTTFVEALVAAPLDLPILLSREGELPPDTEAAMADLDIEDPIRIDSSDPYAASVEAAELIIERGGSLATVHVARADAFPDSLAAAQSGVPLLLVHPRSPTESDPVWYFLDSHRAEIGQIVIFGGEQAIAPEVAERIGRLGRSAG